jgi:hypothetical protein
MIITLFSFLLFKGGVWGAGGGEGIVNIGDITNPLWTLKDYEPTPNNGEHETPF